MLLAMGGMRSKVDESGRVTIPKQLRRSLGIESGTVLEFREEKGRLIAIKHFDTDPISKAIGCLGRGLDTDAMMAKLRGRR